MSEAKSNGSDSLNSFAALLNQKLQTSSKSAKQKPLLKNMAGENP
jgi:hypothetical protein